MSEQSSLAIIQKMELNGLKKENESLRGSLEELMLDFRAIQAQRDQLRKALDDAVVWIEDDRFGDDYIMEDWYHAARAALAQGGQDG